MLSAENLNTKSENRINQKTFADFAKVFVIFMESVHIIEYGKGENLCPT